ncbi:hypothetical protein BX661DRAFT_168711 [Kickxella alabastrina]|uniref:uncharacterized protein n=1 Tax=Kickxella alabastrina TaxID=61397 RepID=UPI0022201B45|nr:uncharacterized protein BX661DRAFT_168711 [Kickxella alabastrina]KAI7834357.1 hypothetical protein BX661DRAFT_168711 [Kickxella alabastrina]
MKDTAKPSLSLTKTPKPQGQGGRGRGHKAGNKHGRSRGSANPTVIATPTAAQSGNKSLSDLIDNQNSANKSAKKSNVRADMARNVKAKQLTAPTSPAGVKSSSILGEQLVKSYGKSSSAGSSEGGGLKSGQATDADTKVMPQSSPSLTLNTAPAPILVMSRQTIGGWLRRRAERRVPSQPARHRLIRSRKPAEGESADPDAYFDAPVLESVSMATVESGEIFSAGDQYAVEADPLVADSQFFLQDATPDKASANGEFAVVQDEANEPVAGLGTLADLIVLDYMSQQIIDEVSNMEPTLSRSPNPAVDANSTFRRLDCLGREQRGSQALDLLVDMQTQQWLMAADSEDQLQMMVAEGVGSAMP